MEPHSFEASATKHGVLLLVALAFAVSGAWMVAEGEGAIGWFVFAFFGLCAGVFARELSRSQPRITIDDAGIHDRTLGVGPIRWDDIEDAYATSIGGHPFVCLVLRDPEVYLDTLSPVRRTLTRANATLGFHELSLNLSGLHGTNPHEIQALILSELNARRRGQADRS